VDVVFVGREVFGKGGCLFTFLIIHIGVDNIEVVLDGQY